VKVGDDEQSVKNWGKLRQVFSIWGWKFFSYRCFS